MPVFTGQHQSIPVLTAKLVDLVDGVGADGLLHSLPLPVQIAQLPGHLLGPGRVVRLQQVGGQVRRAHAPRGIDAGGEHETDLDGGDGLAQQARLLQKGMNAHKIRVGQGLQTTGDDGPVLPLHPHDIGDGADGGQGAVSGEQGVLPVLAAQGQDQLQRHAAAGQMLEGIGAVWPVGVHHSHGVRKIFLTLVVVRDHHIHTQGVGKFHFLIAGDAAVHGDHQCGALIVKPLDGVFGQAVAVLNPPGDIPQAVYAAALEIVHQQHRGGDAVHIVVTKDRDGLSAGDGPLNPGDGLAHVPHQHGGDGQLSLPVQKFCGPLRRGDAPGGQDRGKQIGISGAAQESHVLRLRRADVPFFEFHRTSPPFQGVYKFHGNYMITSLV